MKELTKAEEQIMQILWSLKKGFIKDVIEHFPEPKPAYNTVSTIVRILEKKGFVGYNAFGKTHEYFPIVKKSDFVGMRLGRMVNNYFSSSYKNLVSFFTVENDLTIKEIEELKKLLDREIEKRKGLKNG